MALEELKGETFSEPDADENTKEQSIKQKIYEFAKEQIEEIVISDSDSSLVYGFVGFSFFLYHQFCRPVAT